MQLRESLLEDQRNRPGKGKEQTGALQPEPQPRRDSVTTAAPTEPWKPQLDVPKPPALDPEAIPANKCHPHCQKGSQFPVGGAGI